MSPPHLFSLSNELLIEIISDLRPLDIHACQCTCRRLNNVIVNSQLIQYILRTALSGVLDPLEPGISLPDRLDALERWETAWREMDLSSKPVASIDAVVHEGELLVDYFQYFGEQHVIECRTESGEPASYSFFDLHTWSSSPPTNPTLWTTVDIQIPNVLLFAFAPEINLSVAFSTPVPSDHPNRTVIISPLSFNTGEPHPLASRSKLEVTVSHTAIHDESDAMVIGDYILYWVWASISETHTLCSIYLVAWKEGWISKLRTFHSGVYGSNLSVLSEEIILFIRLHEPALELCRLAIIGDSGNASLETVCILSLPVLTSTALLLGATCSGAYTGHALFSKNNKQISPNAYRHVTTSGSSTRQPEGRVGARRRCLRSVPSDSIVNVVMQVETSSGYDQMIDLIVRRRTLLEFTNPQAQVGAPGVVRMGARTVLMLAWETWGPDNSRILNSWTFPDASLCGERRATALMSRIKMRDYNPYRVRRALASLGVAGRKVTLACGSMVKVVKEASICRGGEFFRDDIETSLSYVETVTAYDGCQNISMDDNHLVVNVFRGTFKRNLHLYSL